MIFSLFIVTHIFNKFEQEALQNIQTSLITNNTKYVKNHLQATTHKIEQLIEKKYTDINILAQVMQELIDHPDK
jgi:2C-methyl-D-erythritol 2,4-cyclodiphosphate synthase